MCRHIQGSVLECILSDPARFDAQFITQAFLLGAQATTAQTAQNYRQYTTTPNLTEIVDLGAVVQCLRFSVPILGAALAFSSWYNLKHVFHLLLAIQKARKVQDLMNETRALRMERQEREWMDMQSRKTFRVYTVISILFVSLWVAVFFSAIADQLDSPE